MQTHLQVLSEDERSQIHERSLRILGKTGVRVETAQGRQILKDAGAEVDESHKIVRFPKELVEEALRLTPKDFTLGARRPGWDLHMNNGDCTLLMSGEGTRAIDRKTGDHRDATFNDWLEATRLGDALDDIGIYWHIVEASDKGHTMADYTEYLHHLFLNFSKHVQDEIASPEQAPWLLEVLQTIFGDKETIRRKHPLSFVLCPQSPLMIDKKYTDAYLALRGWGIPVAVMPMPLMGATAPASMISTAIVGNCEVLATLCLVQAAEPGVPFIYAPIFASIDPLSGLLGGGVGILGAASTEMARFYGLPAESPGSGTHQFVPGIQAGYEKALSALPSMLSRPDILVGAGFLGRAMILSLEQMLIDTEIFRMCKKAHQGISSGEDKWLEEVIDQVGPGGHFLDQPSTLSAVRGDEWYISKLGVHTSFEDWEASGRPSLLKEARKKVDEILNGYNPLPLDEKTEQELVRIHKKAQETEGF